jgi:hypothetical protein
MASLSSLVDRVRVELGDLGKSFVQQFTADGTTNRFRLHYAPLDGTGVVVFKNGVNISNATSVEESTGVLVTDTLPADGDEFTVSGNYYRYFTAAEISMIVQNALDQHSANHTDSLGRKIDASTLPALEEYPVVVYATSLALYTLATDSAFDIDVQAPDGVTIPRAERYRQLTEMVNIRKEQYRDLCLHLGIGMYKMDVFSLRRVSKGTGRYVPVYKPQEVDDRSWPQRVHLSKPTYGDAPTEWPTTGPEITAYQGRSFSIDIEFTGDYADATIVANLLPQRGSVVIAQEFDASIVDNGDNSFTATLSLTSDQTIRIANRTYWSLATVAEDGDKTEIVGGHFFTKRSSEVIV